MDIYVIVLYVAALYVSISTYTLQMHLTYTLFTLSFPYVIFLYVYVHTYTLCWLGSLRCYHVLYVLVLYVLALYVIAFYVIAIYVAIMLST